MSDRPATNREQPATSAEIASQPAGWGISEPPARPVAQSLGRLDAARVELQIDEMVLHGFAAADRQAIGAAVERELARLIGEQGLAPAIARPGARARVDGGAIHLTASAPAAVIGTQIAQAVFAGLIE